MATKASRAANEGAAPNNLRLWDKLGKTDPRHTKPFTRGGGFKGTAMKPMWQNRLLTETFGPCGDGWGFDKPEFQLVHGHDGELLVYCTVSAWYQPDPAKDEICHVYGVGGDKVITKFSTKTANDDEAFKKAFTDAIGNAFKFVGVGADVHMGLFDDSKYVADLNAEFAAADDQLGIDIDTMLDAIKAAKDLDALTALNNSIQAAGGLKERMAAADRGAEWEMVVSTYKGRRAFLTPKPKVVGANDANDGDLSVQ
jgi:hypothetical protein